MLLCLSACRKSTEPIYMSKESFATKTGSFIKYTIRKGQHFTDGNVFTPVETEALKFLVHFDSSAIYQTIVAENQYDINKLYGFSDNNTQHHLYSARIGWRWSDSALRLFAYVYNNGIVSSKELSIVTIGADIDCSIAVAGSEYIFTINDQRTAMPRLSTTPKAKGYLLYPYFGGDEVAPHDVTIRIKNL